MDRFGRYEIDPQVSSESSQDLWSATQQPLLGLARSDPARFMSVLAEAVLPHGGFAVYGAEHTMVNLLSDPDRQNPAYVALMDGAIEFLRSNGVPPNRVTGGEWQHWIGRGGTSSTWLTRLPTPAESAAPITPLSDGEVRRIAQLVAAENSNVLFVRQRENGSYCQVIDARWSDDDPRRVRNDDFQSYPSLYELYVDLGLSLQAPPFWYHEELAPFFPIPAPKI
jgi:hypothetical protein